MKQNYHESWKALSLWFYFCPTQSYAWWTDINGEPSRIKHGSPQELVHVILLIHWATDISQKAEDTIEVVGLASLHRSGEGDEIFYILFRMCKGLYIELRKELLQNSRLVKRNLAKNKITLTRVVKTWQAHTRANEMQWGAHVFI